VLKTLETTNLMSTDFQVFRDFLEDACGILLGDNKEYLVSSRLNKIMTENDIQSLIQLVDKMKGRSNMKLRNRVVDAMTTNETLWFRDSYPFEYLKNTLLPELTKEGSGNIRIWSAACSSGQEPYSMSITTEEFRQSSMGILRRNVEITATDLSPTMLDHCKSAEYATLALNRGLSSERLNTYFDSQGDGIWKVKSSVSSRVQFRELNLMDSYALLGKFDIVFCRNVLIYFSAELKQDILSRIHATLKPGGVLFLGASEGLAGLQDKFEMIQCRPGLAYRAI